MPESNDGLRRRSRFTAVTIIGFLLLIESLQILKAPLQAKTLQNYGETEYNKERVCRIKLARSVFRAAAVAT